MAELADDIIPGVKPAAKHVGKTEAAMWHLVYGGHVPFKKIGRRYYFRRSELDRHFSAAS